METDAGVWGKLGLDGGERHSEGRAGIGADR